MNGAELPCGNILSVQPADLDYKRNGNKKTDNRQKDLSTRQISNNKNVVDDVSQHNALETNGSKVSSTTRTASMNGSNEGGQKKTDDGGEDLDDFFASLED